MEASSLPRFVVFYSESAGKHLSYMSDEGGELNRSVAAKAQNVWNPRAAFEVVESTVHPAMIHIRCSFHYKFMRRRSETETWIVAAAKDQEDDLSQWSSTLFLPELEESAAHTVVRLLHVESGRYLQWYDGHGDSSDPYLMCIRAQSTDPADPKSSFRVVDWYNMVTLPKHLSFSQLTDFKYLGIRDGGSSAEDALQFVEYDGRDRSLENEVIAQPDGSVCIRNVSRDAYWRVNTSTPSNLVFANYHAGTDVPPLSPPPPEILFRPLKAYSDTINLFHLGTNKYCTRDSVEIEDGLRAADDEYSDKDANKLTLGTTLTSTRIEDIKSDLDAGWVHFENHDMVLNPGVDVSNESGKTKTFKVELPYYDIRTRQWKGTTSTFILGPILEIEPDQVPYIGDSATIKSSTPSPMTDYEWGSPKPVPTNSPIIVHEVEVPPMTKVTAKLFGTLATCEVPFTYTRYDLPAGGQPKEVYFMEDGRFSGPNYYDIRVEVTPPQPILITKNN